MIIVVEGENEASKIKVEEFALRFNRKELENQINSYSVSYATVRASQSDSNRRLYRWQ